jgi:hypothetical protein
MATDTTRVSSYARFEGYKDSSGTLLVPNFTNLNGAAYAATSHQMAFGTQTVTGTATFAHGLATVAYVQVTPAVSALCWITVTGGANITVTLTSGAVAATGTVHWMAVND